MQPTITERAKERFKRDNNLPLRLFVEPYFTTRLKLYNPFYDTLRKWDLYLLELAKYENDELYFAEYNRVKEVAMESIKTNEAFLRFNNEDMNQFALKNKGFPSKDIFHPQNIGHYFVSIDMKKANFSSLKHYDRAIFGADTWEEFIGKFTNSEYIQGSKYIREVILGNCNPKRHITYEKHLMDELLTEILTIVDAKVVVSFSNDEIVLDLTTMTIGERNKVISQVQKVVDGAKVPLRVEPFLLLGVINPIDKRIFGYLREVEDVSKNEKEIDFKGLNNYVLPFVMRKLLNQDVMPEDMVFDHEGMLATYITPPKIAFVSEYED